MADSNMRIEWLDAAKGIGILMVMFGHNWLEWKYCYYFNSFHMPLFFILAGYTFSDRRAPFDFIRQKAKVLIIPYVLFVFCNLHERQLACRHSGRRQKQTGHGWNL